MIYLYLFGTCFHFIYVFMIIDKYYDNLTDTKYCMQASTYLSDKAFLNEYDY